MGKGVARAPVRFNANSVQKLLQRQEQTPAETSSTKKEENEETGSQEERRVSDIGSISFVSCATGEDAMTTLGGNQETEEGNYLFILTNIFVPVFFCACLFFYSFVRFSEGKTRLTKETAVEIGMFY